MRNKNLLLSVTKNDLEIQTFRSGGAGGQNQNKVSSGVRIIHKDSGAVGVARDSRDQLHNKKSAFVRMTQTPKFQAWLKLEIARKLGQLTEIEEAVNDQMQDKNLRIEYLDE